MLTIIEAIQGKNRCFTTGRFISGLCAPLVHDTGANNPHAGRYVECPDFLEGINYKNSYKNYWNFPTLSKMVHAFIGIDSNGKIVIAQSLPLEFCCWGCGGGKNGSYNYPAKKSAPKQFAHVQFEICEDNKRDKNYYEQAMDTAAEYCAWLIQNGYCSTDVGLVICHRDAARAGFGSNHGDILDWASVQGETDKTYMNSFRERVRKYLALGQVQVEWHYGSSMYTCKQSTRYNSSAWYLQKCLNKLGYTCEMDGLLWNETLSQLKAFQRKWSIEDDGVCGSVTWKALMSALNGEDPPKQQTVQHYRGIVKTSNSGYVSLFKDVEKTEKIVKIYDGKTVEVVGNNESGTTMAKAIYEKYSGYVDTQYITDRVYIYDEVVETPPTEEVVPVQHYTATVQTKFTGYVSLWKTVLKTSRVCTVKDGETVEVTSDNIKGALAPAKYGVYNGYVDTSYLINKKDVK